MKSSVFVSFRGAAQAMFHAYELIVVSILIFFPLLWGKSSNLTHIVFNWVVKATAIVDQLWSCYFLSR